MQSTDRVIVFDIDGTLAETAVYWLPVLKEFTREVERRHGITSAVQPIEDALQLLGTSDRSLLAKMFPDRPDSDYAAFQQLSKEIWKPLIEKHPFQLYQGAAELLSSLKDQGWKILLSSNCDNWYMDQMLRHTALGKHVSAHACAEMYPGLEKWEFTRKMLAAQPPFEVGYMVGDSCSDMKAGRMNGLRTIYASYGYAVCEDESIKDHIIQDLGEVLDITSSNQRR